MFSIRNTNEISSNVLKIFQCWNFLIVKLFNYWYRSNLCIYCDYGV